jgi:hypothetical protein
MDMRVVLRLARGDFQGAPLSWADTPALTWSRYSVWSRGDTIAIVSGRNAGTVAVDSCWIETEGASRVITTTSANRCGRRPLSALVHGLQLKSG